MAEIDKIAKSVADAISAEARVMEFGFEHGEYGQLTLKGECRITLYRVLNDWEIDIVLPDGSVVGCDVPCEQFGGKTRQELADRG